MWIGEERKGKERTGEGRREEKKLLPPQESNLQHTAQPSHFNALAYMKGFVYGQFSAE